MLLTFLVIFLFYHECACEASCKQNAQLPFFAQSTTEHGITFDRLVVNGSASLSIIYAVTSSNVDLDTIVLEHDGRSITLDDDPKAEAYYTYEQKNGTLLVTLHFPTPQTKFMGDWPATIKTSDGETHTATCFIEAPPIIQRKPGTFRATEGSSLILQCEVDSSPPPTSFIWKRLQVSDDGNTLVSVSNATFQSRDGIENSDLVLIGDASSTGFYMCTATSPMGTDNMFVEVRIKGISTYLWPCIGLVLEIIVLVVTIGIYERNEASRRRRRAQAESSAKLEL